jgi:hypothetical protein
VRRRELGHRIVSVAHEHPLVERLGSLTIDDLVVLDRCRDAGVWLVEKLFEQDSAQAFLGARIPAEQRAHHDLGKIAEREDPSVNVRHIAPE